MTMKPRSSKQKGSRFEGHLLKVFRETLDANAHLQPSSGSGYDKNDIRLPGLNVEVEAKNAKTFNVQADWEQAKAQRTPGNMAVLAVRHPRRSEFLETVVVIDLDDFIGLLQDRSGIREVSFTASKGVKWKVQRLVESAKSVLKEFDNHS